MASYIALGLIGFITTLLLTELFIRLSRSLGLGQHIRDYGPEIHVHKIGTPTMGGAVILLSLILILMSIYILRGSLPPRLTLLASVTLGFGLIGLADDLIGLLKRRSLGLLIRYKLLLQLAVSLLFFFSLKLLAVSGEIKIPFSDAEFTLPWPAYLILTILVLMSTVNSMNLTDGLDGLATGVTVVMLSSYLIILRGETDLLGLIVAFILSLLGFLWFNFYPARVFLGDTGAFALGGFVGALTILTGKELFLPIIGGVLVIEALSVVVQVASYKIAGIRVFKVSPLHHHFEKAKGIDYPFLLPNIEWAEPQITIRFWILSAMLGLIGIWAHRI